MAFCLVLAAVIVVATDRGRVVIRSEPGDVKVVIKEDGKEIATIDLKAGSQVKWLSTGNYELELSGNDNDVKLDRSSFPMTRLGKVIITAELNREKLKNDSPKIDPDVSQVSMSRRFEGHSAPIRGLAAHPDGRTLMSASADNSLRIWDIETDEQLSCLFETDLAQQPRQRKFTPLSFAVSPDGNTVATGHYNGTIRVWDLQAKKQRHLIHAHQGIDLRSSRIYSLTFTPDGKQLLSCSHDKTAKFWDVASGEVVRQFTFDKRIHCGAMSPAGDHFVVAWYEHATLSLLSCASGEPVKPFSGHDSFVVSCTFSPDGRLLATGSNDKSVCIWDVATGRRLHRMTGHQNAPQSVIFTHDGQHVISGSADQTIRIWDVGVGREVHRFAADKSVTSEIVLTLDGRSIISGAGESWNSKLGWLEPNGDYAIRLWRLPERIWPLEKQD